MEAVGTADSGQRDSIGNGDCGRRLWDWRGDSGRWTVDGGQWAVDSRQWALTDETSP